MPKFEDLTGRQFGEWTVIKRAESLRDSRGFPVTMFQCMCSCGNVRDVRAFSLKNGRSRSCGCKQRESAAEWAGEHFKTHGGSKTRLYKIWAGMKKRCYDTNATNYYLYGGRGITIADEWIDDYPAFKEWANDNGYNDYMTIDRIDVNGNYTPDNCRWVSRAAQNNNRRSNRYIEYNGETHTIAEWAKITNMAYSCLRERLVKNNYIATKEILNQV